MQSAMANVARLLASSRRAIHLIESLVALAVLSLILVAVFTLMPASILAVKKGEVSLRADTLAQSVLERTRAQSYPGLALDSITVDPPLLQDGVQYTAHLGIYSVDGVASEREKLLRVEVTGSFRSHPFLVRHEQVVCNVRR